jgi:hypothetical protein
LSQYLNPSGYQKSNKFQKFEQEINPVLNKINPKQEKYKNSKLQIPNYKQL